jgi:hypothetical protein
MGGEARDFQSGETDKPCHTRDFDRPQAKSVFAEMLLDVINHRVALNAIKRTSEEFHNSGIGIHDGKRFPILVTPLTQADATGAQIREGAHSSRAYGRKQAMAILGTAHLTTGAASPPGQSGRSLASHCC